MERETGTFRVKSGLAEMLKGGVIMDVTTAEQARIAEEAGATAVTGVDVFGPTPEFDVEHRRRQSAVRFVLGDATAPETLARIGVGLGEAAANPCSHSLVADYFPRKDRAVALGVYLLGIYFGGSGALVIGGLILQHWPSLCHLVPLGSACGLPGCPPIETVVAFWTEDDRRHQFKLFKPVEEVVPDDLPFAWLREALVFTGEEDCC